MRGCCSNLMAMASVLAGGFLFAGCAGPTRRNDARPVLTPVTAPKWHDELRLRTQVEFSTGILYKPNQDSAQSDAVRFAPLILLNAEHAECAVENAVWTTSGLQERPAQRCMRVDYGWQVRCPSPGSATVEGYGLSIALGSDGFPLWARAARWSNGRFEPETVFVSRSLEAAAIARYRSPAPGRAYVIERSLDEAPDQVVAGILEDGPVPMGPYVYIDPLRSGVVTIVCRCSPSQVGSITTTAAYEPLDETSYVERRNDSWFINGAYPKFRRLTDGPLYFRKQTSVHDEGQRDLP